jgi:hypothetical protein
VGVDFLCAHVRLTELNCLSRREEAPNRNQPYIHLRTLSGNVAHPRANVPILSTNHRVVSWDGQSQIQIAGNKVGFIWDEREAEVFQVWCWDSGGVIWVRCACININ